MDRNKKRAAAIVGVMAYIQSEEASGVTQAQVPIPENLYYQLKVLYEHLRLLFQ